MPIVLIDRKHRKWFWILLCLTAAGLLAYFLLPREAPGRRPGGSTVGLWYGTIAALLMIYAGLLSAHRKLPRWWATIGPRKTWLRGHIWLGLLSGVFLLLHSGFSWGGPLEIALWIAFLGVLISGIYGLILQQLLPRLITTRVNYEAPYEQIPHLCLTMRRKADRMVDSLCGEYEADKSGPENTISAIQYAGNALAQLRDFYEQLVRPFLSPKPPRKSPLLDPLQAEARFDKLRNLPGLAEAADTLNDLAGFCEERRQMYEQERMHFWLHSWLIVHIPSSVVLLVLGITHVITALYY